MQSGTKGFSLIELMIAVAILGILSSIAYPSYVDYVTRSARADALAGLVHVANLQEQYYLDHRKYATKMSELNLSPVKGDGARWVVENEMYEISAVVPEDGKSFNLLATAVEQQDKREIEACKVIELTNTNKRKTEDKECWE
ncbi:prepilin-type cleavage/methylation domain-containing protein [Shewanella sp. OPT22]|nr:prepilin-type cleavage/methylation domain-containing protein [Shewanella sp. OPT22]